MSVVGRLAPSPTGLLHLGHARTFLLAYWSARAQGGRLLLRRGGTADGGRGRRLAWHDLRCFARTEGYQGSTRVLALYLDQAARAIGNVLHAGAPIIRDLHQRTGSADAGRAGRSLDFETGGWIKKLP